MQRLSWLICAAIVWMGAVPHAAWAQAEEVDRVIARVNTTILTRSDLNKTVTEMVRRGELPARQATSAAVIELFDDTLLLDEAKKTGVTVSDTALREQVDEVLKDMQRNYGSAEAFARAMERDGSNEAKLKEDLMKRLRDEARMKQLVMRRFSVSEAEAARYEAEAGRTVGKFSLRRLGVPVGANRNAALARVATLRDRIREEGLSFEAGVRKYTEIPDEKPIGGSLGTMEAAKMSDKLLAAVKDLKTGQVSAPVVLGGYACVVYVEGRQSAQGLLMQQRFISEREKLLGELRRAAQIEVFDEVVRELLPADYSRGVLRGAAPTPAPETSAWDRLEKRRSAPTR